MPGTPKAIDLKTWRAQLTQSIKSFESLSTAITNQIAILKQLQAQITQFEQEYNGLIAQTTKPPIFDSSHLERQRECKIAFENLARSPEYQLFFDEFKRIPGYYSQKDWDELGQSMTANNLDNAVTCANKISDAFIQLNRLDDDTLLKMLNRVRNSASQDAKAMMPSQANAATAAVGKQMTEAPAAMASSSAQPSASSSASAPSSNNTNLASNSIFAKGTSAASSSVQPSASSSASASSSNDTNPATTQATSGHEDEASTCTIAQMK